MNFLTRDQIEKADDTQTAVVDVSEWGGQVKVKSLTGRARSNIEAKVQREVSPGEIRIDVVMGGVCDESGNLLFTDKGDRKWLQEKNASVLDRIAEQILRISGMSEDAVEEAEGN